MANFKKHLVTGAIVGTAIAALRNYLLQQNRKTNDPAYQFNYEELLGQSLKGAAVGGFFGVLPDLIEPATNPHHRKLFHSVATGSAIGYGMVIANTCSIPEESREFINLAGASYLSHLMLDSETSFGLPLVA